MLKFKWETEFKETEIGEIARDWDVKTIQKSNYRIVMGQSKPATKDSKTY